MQVFFVCSDAAVFALCPVAPFHAPVSLSAVKHLQESTQQQQDGGGQSTMRAWLTQVTSGVVPTPPECIDPCYFENQIRVDH